MVSSHYVEDIFLEFYMYVSADRISVQWHDSTPIASFGSTLDNGNVLTKAQSDYILRILTKYKQKAKEAGLDYEKYLENPLWKKSFRVLDNSKKVHVEEDPESGPQVCLKFPFEFKKVFDLEFQELLGKSTFKTWDSDRKLRIIPLYDINVIKLYEFLNNNGFELDDSFVAIVATIEEAWEQQETIIPHSVIVENSIVLKNTTEDTDNWWNENKTGDLYQDMFTAKSIGYPLRQLTAPSNDIEKIATSDSNMFWIQNNISFFELYKKLNTGSVCIMLDRASDIHEWIRNFVMHSTQAGIDRADIKVCFRETDLSKKHRFNEWIREQGLGGSVGTGRIFIFENKPAKWLFTKNIDVKLIVTNNLYPNTNTMTQQWLEHHPCVVYLGDIKPSQKRNTKIVHL